MDVTALAPRRREDDRQLTQEKYARKLETEDAHFDLQAEFLDLILHLNCDKMRETGDGAMVQYLSRFKTCCFYHNFCDRQNFVNIFYYL